MRLTIFWLALALASLPGLAQAETPASASVASPDPAKLVIASRIALRLVPEDDDRAGLAELLDNIHKHRLQGMITTSLQELARDAGLTDKQIAAIAPTSQKAIMSTLDPAFDQRIKKLNAAIDQVLIKQLYGVNPKIRERLATAYANRFSIRQLDDIDAFFAMPSGNVFAAANLQLMNDPGVANLGKDCWQ